MTLNKDFPKVGILVKDDEMSVQYLLGGLRKMI